VILLDAKGLAASRPGRPLFDDLSLTLSDGDRLAVVGLNGCGKSTLLRQLAGTDEPESGIIRRGRGTRVVMLDQTAGAPDEPDRASDRRANAGARAAGSGDRAGGADGVGTSASGRFADVDVARTAIDVVGGEWDGRAILERLGLGPMVDRPMNQLSGGQAKRVALARALVEVGEVGHGDESVVLILDEPTNHLDIDAIAWLEERLAQHRGALVLVSHDRHVLDRVTTRILEIDRGHSHVHEGGYDSYLVDRAERADRAESAESVRRNLAKRELAWLRRGAKARSTKAKARVTSATALVEARPEPLARVGSLDLSEAARLGTRRTGEPGYTAAAKRERYGMPRLGDVVIELEGVGHRFGDGPWLFRNVELKLAPGERIGILGPNGAGKSTLSEILAGAITPLEGRVVTGPTVVVGAHRQRGPELDPTTRVRDAVAGPHRVPDASDARLLEQFWFDADAQHAPVGLLSGGERRRLQLLLTLAQKPNVLLLDEPTNDLDLDTLRVLEDYLDDWPGTAVLVSDDRTFLERTGTDVVAIELAKVRRVPGGYPAYERDRIANRSRTRVGTTAAMPDVVASAAAVAATRKKGATSAATGRNGATNPEAAESTSTRSSGAPAPRSATTLRFLLKEVEKDQRRLQRRRNELTTQVADPEVIADHAKLAELGRELGEVETELAGVDERWLELTIEADG
jgi:ATP-binding cassette subfamily F protein uup